MSSNFFYIIHVIVVIVRTFSSEAQVSQYEFKGSLYCNIVDRIIFPKARSPLECSVFCSLDDICKSFFFSSADQSCTGSTGTEHATCVSDTLFKHYALDSGLMTTTEVATTADTTLDLVCSKDADCIDTWSPFVMCVYGQCQCRFGEGNSTGYKCENVCEGFAYTDVWNTNMYLYGHLIDNIYSVTEMECTNSCTIQDDPLCESAFYYATTSYCEIKSKSFLTADLTSIGMTGDDITYIHIYREC